MRDAARLELVRRTATRIYNPVLTQSQMYVILEELKDLLDINAPIPLTPPPRSVLLPPAGNESVPNISNRL